MPNSTELYLVLKAIDPFESGEVGPLSRGLLSAAPPPPATDAPSPGPTGDVAARVPPKPPAPALMSGPAQIAHRPPQPPAPVPVAVIVDHLPPKPPAPMAVPMNVQHVPPKPPGPVQQAMVTVDSMVAKAPATMLSVALDDEPLQPPKSLRIQSVTIYGSREVALAWLSSIDGQEFAKDAQALQLLRVSADDDA